MPRRKNPELHLCERSNQQITSTWVYQLLEKRKKHIYYEIYLLFVT